MTSSNQNASLLRDLRTTSHNSGHGVNITEAEFNKMKSNGQLDSLMKKYGEFSVRDLDTDRNGKINEYDVKSGKHSDQHFIRTGERSGSSSGSNSHEKVVLQFGWSDTSTSTIDSALRKVGIDNFKRSNSSDKGLGIAVVTRDQANAFREYANGSKKIFANIQSARGGIDSTDDLRVSFSKDLDSSGRISFGGNDYGGIVTDDPSGVVSGSAIGQQKGDDALWSTDRGNSAKAQMWDGPGGRQYVTMSASIEN